MALSHAASSILTCRTLPSLPSLSCMPPSCRILLLTRRTLIAPHIAFCLTGPDSYRLHLLSWPLGSNAPSRGASKPQRSTEWLRCHCQPTQPDPSPTIGAPLRFPPAGYRPVLHSTYVCQLSSVAQKNRVGGHALDTSAAGWFQASCRALHTLPYHCGSVPCSG